MPVRLKICFFFVAFLATFLFFQTKTSATGEVLINEFSPASAPEWVEIYNPSDETISLKEVILFFDDNPETSQKLSFCDGETITAHTFKLIIRPERSFWLANNGDSLVLKRGDDVIDAIAYGSEGMLKAPTATQSATRAVKGGSEWVITNNPTQEGETVSFTCPTPEPPTETAPVVTPTPTPLPEDSSLILEPTPTSKARGLVATLAGEVLGEEIQPWGIYLLEPSPSPGAAEEGVKNNQRLSVLSLGSGFVFLSAAGLYLWYTKWRCPG